MSSLMVSNDLEIMMLEFAIQKLFVPKTSTFDSVILKKTTVMFRMLDYDWTALNPHRTDYVPYRGSNLEEEDFHGGKSVVFAIPSARLEKKINDVDIHIHVRKEVSKYFEMDSCQNVGIALVNVDGLFNGIIKELRERKELEEYLSGFHKRQPISRSLKGTYEITDEDRRVTGATITLYVRISHFGKSIITEIETDRGKRRDFYAQEETNESYPYQCKELKRSKLESGCWGSETFLPPLRPDQLICHCETWDPMVDRRDDKSDDSEDETRIGTDSSDRPTGKDKKVRNSRGDGNGRGSGKNVGKGKKVSKGDGVRGGNDKTEVLAGKRGKKLGDDETVVKRDSQIGDGSKVKKKSLSAGSKRGGKSSHQGASAKMEKFPRGRSGGSVRSYDPKEITNKPLKRTSDKTERREDLKDRKMLEKSKDKIAQAEKEKRRLQLRRRHCGVITVGLQDKEKKICLKVLEASSVSPCPQMFTSIQPTICSNLHPLRHCCYPSISDCKPTMSLPLNCSMCTRNDRSCRLPGRPGAMNMTEMSILTS